MLSLLDGYLRREALSLSPPAFSLLMMRLLSRTGAGTIGGFSRLSRSQISQPGSRTAAAAMASSDHLRRRLPRLRPTPLPLPLPPLHFHLRRAPSPRASTPTASPSSGSIARGSSTRSTPTAATRSRRRCWRLKSSSSPRRDAKGRRQAARKRALALSSSRGRCCSPAPGSLRG